MSGCVVGSDGSRACHGAPASGDVTSLLQMHARQQDAEEHQDKRVAGRAAVTRRCSDLPPDEGCLYSDWADWGGCSKTCGSGERSRSRTVTSAPGNATCGCLEEAETCNSEACTDEPIGPTDEPIGPPPTTTPAPPGIKVCGTVRDASDFKNVIDKATVVIGSFTTETDSSGKFCAEVPQGDYTLTATKQPEWLDTKQPLTVVESREDITVDMSKKLPPKDWRIILSWPKTPLDLDARTQFGGKISEFTGDCHVAYNSKGPKTCPQNGIEGHLDQDHCFLSTAYPGASWSTPGKPCGASATAESKPETTTLTNVDPSTCKNDCKIGFMVSNYVANSIYFESLGHALPDGVPQEDTGTLADSEATVRVIHGDEEVAFFEIAKQQGFIQWPGTLYSQWNVFYIDVSTSTVVECKDGSCFS